MTFRQVDIDNLANYGSRIGDFANNYDHYATSQHDHVGSVRENVSIIMFGSAVKKNEISDVITRAFAMANKISVEIARLQQ